jgi:hypothetical protein
MTLVIAFWTINGMDAKIEAWGSFTGSPVTKWVDREGIRGGVL